MLYFGHTPNIALGPLFFLIFKPSSLVSAAYVTNSWMCATYMVSLPRANSLLFWQLSITKSSSGRWFWDHFYPPCWYSVWFEFAQVCWACCHTSPLRSYHDFCWRESFHFCLFCIWTMTFICKAMVSCSTANSSGSSE